MISCLLCTFQIVLCLFDATKYIGIAGRITITSIDEIEKRISGIFNFSMVNVEDVTKTISITDGEFKDLKYTQTSISENMINIFFTSPSFDKLIRF